MNIDFQWHDVGNAGEFYSEKIRALRNVSGVYVIYDRVEQEITYIGESHTGRLYKTMTRHFQRWKNDQTPYGYDRKKCNYVIERHDAMVDWIVIESILAIRWFETYLIERFQPEGNLQVTGTNSY